MIDSKFGRLIADSSTWLDKFARKEAPRISESVLAARRRLDSFVLEMDARRPMLFPGAGELFGADLDLGRLFANAAIAMLQVHSRSDKTTSVADLCSGFVERALSRSHRSAATHIIDRYAEAIKACMTSAKSIVADARGMIDAYISQSKASYREHRLVLDTIMNDTCTATAYPSKISDLLSHITIHSPDVCEAICHAADLSFHPGEQCGPMRTLLIDVLYKFMSDDISYIETADAFVDYTGPASNERIMFERARLPIKHINKKSKYE
jgi:hypothetical protein